MAEMHRFAASFVALTVFWAGPAAAECRIGDPTLDQHIVAKRQLAAGGDTNLVRNLRKLRRAAYLLKKHRRDDACEAVIAAIQDILRKPGADGADHRNRPSHPGAKWPDLSSQRASSKTITAIGGRIRADRLIGSDLIGLQDEGLGEIEDLILDADGSPAYVLVSRGGFFGLGEKTLAVPFAMLRVSDDRDVFFLPMTASQLEAAPSFDRGRFDWIGDQTWRTRLQHYFEENTTPKN